MASGPPAEPPTPGTEGAEASEGGRWLGDGAARLGPGLARFLGKWKDSQGSDILVEPPRPNDKEEKALQLKVQLSRQGPSARTFVLWIHWRNNGKHTCGHYELCDEMTTNDEVHWLNQKDIGRRSLCWRRPCPEKPRAPVCQSSEGSSPSAVCSASAPKSEAAEAGSSPSAVCSTSAPKSEAAGAGSFPSAACSASTRSSEEAGTGRSGHDMPRLELISRKLSQVLRHGARIAVREDGFCKVGELLELRRLQELRCSLEDLKMIVEGRPESGNSKERFQLLLGGEEGPLIRAVQGHSRKDVKAESAHRRLAITDWDLPAVCVHGTYRWHWPSILRRGLLPGGLKGRHQRSEVHFACAAHGKERAVSGMRSDCNLVIWLDVRRALKDGLPLYVSENGVILSPVAVPSMYFLRAVEYTAEQAVILWDAGRAMR